ncbi:MAG: hypothetical protein J6C43_01965 [Oscillospiraceae bacterium]|nr:hypothetical protein [Oscillospiraceae bacterium]MBP3520045.1 hypothetical protein [Oscillospiraceae bacterium]
MIRTVLGDIDRSRLGMTLAHEHFIIDLDRIRKDGISRIDTPEEVIPEIRLMMEDGIQSAFEVSTIDLGRDVEKLRTISQATGLQIVASTGYYLSPFHPAELESQTPEEIARIYEKELLEGIGDTGIRAGLIAEIASSPEAFVGQEKKILVAAGIASRRTGAAVSTHTGRLTAHETIQILLDQGMDPDKIILGHQDLIDDHEYHLSLLEHGVNIAFDTCGKSAYMPDEIRARNVLSLIREGYGDHLVLSNDISRRTYFTSAGGPGYVAVMRIVVPLLRQQGATEEELRKLLVDNPARIVDNDWRQVSCS